MKTYYECIPCLLQSIIRLFENGQIQEVKKEIIIKKILEDLSKKAFNYSPPNLAQRMYKIIKKETENNDPYKEVKYKCNKLCMKIYDNLKERIIKSKNPRYSALKLSVLGNIIDYGPNHSFNLLETVSIFEDINFSIDDSSHLFNDIKNSDNILFLGDNAGEIVFDKLFLEILNHSKINYVVRGLPILNDSTQSDSKLIGMNEIAHVIDTGIDFPGIDLEQSSSELKNAFKSADFIISKGQGNYESLCDFKDKTIYFLLMAKCNPVAKQLGVKEGDIVVVQNNNFIEVK